MISLKGLLFLYFLIAIPGNNGNEQTNSPAEVSSAGDESNDSGFPEVNPGNNGNEQTNSPAEVSTAGDESNDSGFPEVNPGGNDFGLSNLSAAEKEKRISNYETCYDDLSAAKFALRNGMGNYAFAHRNDHINSSAGEKPTITDDSKKSETVSRNDHINSSAGEKPTKTDDSKKSETVSKDREMYRLYLDYQVETYLSRVIIFDSASEWCSKKYNVDLIEVCTTKLREIFHDSTGLQNYVTVFNELLDLRQRQYFSDHDLLEFIDFEEPEQNPGQVKKDDVKLYKGYILTEGDKITYILNANAWCEEKYLQNPVI